MYDTNTTKSRATELIRSNRLSEAKSILEKYIKSFPDDIDGLNLLSTIHGMESDFAACEKYCRKALKINPVAVNVLNNLGNALMHQGNLKDAEKYIRKSLDIDPDNSNVYSCLGRLLHKQNKHNKALDCYKKAIYLDPSNFNAYSNLGVIYQELDKPDEAMSNYLTAINLNQASMDPYYNVGTLYSSKKQFDIARKYYKKAISINPGHVEAWTRLGSAYLAQKNTDEAISCYEHAIKINPGDIDSLYVYGMALKEIGNKTGASIMFNKILKLDPDHELAGYFLASLGDTQIPEKAPTKYVTELFDGYADTFDEHLTNKLKYKTPSLLRDIVNEVKSFSPHSQNILDLGCGTGLSGVAFSDISRNMTGVDLSSKMIDKASELGLYNEFHIEDFVQAMVSMDRKFDVVISADSLVYVGDLKDIFREAARVIHAGGIFTFSTEKLENNGAFTLNGSGRYSHSELYISELLSNTGFRVIALKDVVIRHENNIPLFGQLYVAARSE